MKALVKLGLAVSAACAAVILLLPRHAGAQGALKIIYGPQGLQKLSYNGVVLEDLGLYPSDSVHIWHLKITDLQGNAITSGQYGWGENNDGRSWDPASHTWTYLFTWGSIQIQYVQSGDTLNMIVTQVNRADSGIVLDGAVVYPLVLNFPQLPVGFANASYPQLAYNITAPSVTVADFGSGEVAAVVPDATRPLYSGFTPTGSNSSYTALISGTAPDGLATFQPHHDRPLVPGQTDTFTVSLRFAPSGTPSSSLAVDAYKSWAATWPPQLNWTDRRIIGTAYLSSAPSGSVNQPSGFPNNPRRYFNDSNAADFDVRTPSGLAAFQAKVLRQAQANVDNLRALNAQGAITWDIEGQQYPQETSYVCSPDQIALVAPEMESIVTDPGSPYAGIKLDDAYFKTMRDAGFRVGVCIRPQHFNLNGDGTAQQVYLPDSAIGAEILGKMKYAHDRWGATLFYIDSTVESNGAVLDAAILQQAAAALPDSLLIPEESTPKYYAYTAPFQTFIFHGDTGTNASVYSFYPRAFSAILINDVAPDVLAQHRVQLTQSVRNGDILMTHADYWQANNPTIVQMYSDAGGSVAPPTPAPTPTPTPTPAPSPTPNPHVGSNVVITTPPALASLSGSVLVQAQVNVALDAAGSYLMVDGIEIGSHRAQGPQFTYALDTTTIADGQHTLQIWAHDVANNTDLSSPIMVTVSNNASSTSPAPLPSPMPPGGTSPWLGFPIALTYPAAAQAVSGTIQAAALISQTLDAAGSFLLVDGAEWGTGRVSASPYLYPLDTTALTPGTHTLQIWAHDTNNDTLLSNITNILVTR